MYKTKDLYGAVTLRSLGHPITKTIRYNNNPVVFVFDISNEIAEVLIKKYWDREISVDARTFVESINELKSIIHSSHEEV